MAATATTTGNKTWGKIFTHLGSFLAGAAGALYLVNSTDCYNKIPETDLSGVEARIEGLEPGLHYVNLDQIKISGGEIAPGMPASTVSYAGQDCASESELFCRQDSSYLFVYNSDTHLLELRPYHLEEITISVPGTRAVAGPPGSNPDIPLTNKGNGQ